MTDKPAAPQPMTSNAFTVNADGTSPYHVDLAQPERLAAPEANPIVIDAGWLGGAHWTCKHGNESSIAHHKLECGCSLVVTNAVALPLVAFKALAEEWRAMPHNTGCRGCAAKVHADELTAAIAEAEKGAGR